MASVFGPTLSFDLSKLSEAQREWLGEKLVKSEGTELNLANAKRAFWHGALQKARDQERVEQQEAAQAAIKPTPIGEVP